MIPFRRSQPKRSGLSQTVARLGGLIPGMGGGAGRRSRGSSSRGKGSGGRGAKGPAGLAVLAGAAGIALKNRDRIGEMFRRGSHDQPGKHEPATAPGMTPDATVPPGA